MKRNVIIILAAALLVTTALPWVLAPHRLDEVYNAEIISDSKTAEETADISTQEETDADIPAPDEEEEEEEEAEEAADEAGASAPELPEESAAAKDEVQPQGTEINRPEPLPNGESSEAELEEAASEEQGQGPEEEEPDKEPRPAYREPAVGFTVLSATEAVVTNHAELDNALSNDNGITTVYFGGDITMQAGIKINSKKIGIIIDGFNPLDPGQTQPYTLTEIDSASFYDTIYADYDYTGLKTIHVRDLIIIGKNFYGPFSVYDVSGLAGFVITYERVDYNGPQLCHNRRGTAHVIDCTVRIHGGNGTRSSSQEFAEAKHLVFEGDNQIDSESSAYSVFWHPGGGTFEIADDASLTLTSPNTSIAFGVFFADSYLNDVDITIGRSAAFNAMISGIVAPELYTTLNSFTVREGGTFALTTTKTATAVVLRMGGALTVEKDAKFSLYGYGGASYAMLRQESGDIYVGKDATFHITANSAYTTLINLIGRTFSCDDPASVLLINANRLITATTSAARVSVNAQQVNYWNTVNPGGFDNPPLYGWRKADDSNLVIDGTLAIGANANFSNLSSNHNAANDPPNVSPSVTTFNMVNARVLAFGRLELLVAELTTNSTAIGGVTAPDAAVRASFTQQGTDYAFPDAEANSEGVFHIPAGIALDSGTVVNVKSSWQYLTAEVREVVAEEGDLEFFVPKLLEFYTTPIATHKKTVKRLDPHWKIVVSDTRAMNGTWNIYARLDSEMTPASATFPALTGALVFINETGGKTVMDTGSDTLIFKHTPESGEDIFPIIWDENKGVLLEVEPGAVCADTPYTASISWTLVDGV